MIPLGRLISCVRDMMVVDGEVCEELEEDAVRRNKRWRGEGNFISDRIELPRRKEPSRYHTSYTHIRTRLRYVKAKNCMWYGNE